MLRNGKKHSAGQAHQFLVATAKSDPVAGLQIPAHALRAPDEHIKHNLRAPSAGMLTGLRRVAPGRTQIRHDFDGAGESKWLFEGLKGSSSSQFVAPCLL